MNKKSKKDIKKCPIIKDECWGNNCEFYMEFSSINNQTKELKKWYQCAFVANVIQNAQNLIQNERLEASIEDLRNKTIERQDKAMNIFNVIRHKNKIGGSNG